MSRLRRTIVRLQDLWRNFWIAVGNLARRASPQKVDYVVLDLSGALPEYIPPAPRWQKYLPPLPGMPTPPEGLSLHALRQILERIAGDPRPKGVVIRLNGFAPPGWATVNSVRQALLRFRGNGKRVVALADEYSTPSYFAASAADEIVIAPHGAWGVLGLRLELTFLKDALAVYGVQADVVNVSPYKTAGDTLSRSDISPEHREMLDWLLDGQYDEIVTAIAQGRKMEVSRVRELIDAGPMLAEEAQAKGLVDRVCHFDELAGALKDEGGRKKEAEKQVSKTRRKKKEAVSGARLTTWAAASRILVRPTRRRSGKAIGVVTVEGTIVPGKSQRFPSPIPLPFLGNAMAGAESVSQALRRVEKDDDVAAVVCYVDSRGGSASASAAIWREVERVRRKKPVVVYMGNTAASGGYYVSASADWIVAQTLTVTGSIGVILMKLAVGGLLERFRANEVYLERGARAGLFNSSHLFSDDEREFVRRWINGYYGQFKQVVVAGRKMEEAALEPIAGGRVWLGKQANERGLVDQLGDFESALVKARELAKLRADEWTPPVWIGPGRGGLLPSPFPAQGWEAWLSRLESLCRERVWMILPYEARLS